LQLKRNYTKVKSNSVEGKTMNKSIYMLILCCLLIGCGNSEVQPVDEDDINPLDDSMYDPESKPKKN
tara:strand:- start:1016 stop:1216 length:201 start_codon:yes stop_codon:yes gene_type:complete